MRTVSAETEYIAEQAISGDKDSFAALYESVYKDMYKFAVYTLRSRDDAADAVAESAMYAYKEIAGLKNAGAFRSWIFAILANRCRAIIRDYAKDNRIAPMDEIEWAIDDGVIEHDERLAIREAYAALPEDDRLILALYVFAGYKSREIADIMDMKHSTVRSRIKRALDFMRKELSDE